MPDIVVMFFILGLVAGVVKSDLSVPKAAYDTLSLLLMLTIGLKGGMALHGNLSWQLVGELACVTAMGAILPLLLFPILRKVVGLTTEDAASLTAHYGSVSAGTFAVALAFAMSMELDIGAEVTLYLVLLELPAILVGLALYKRFGKEQLTSDNKGLWHETLTNRGVILLVGGVIIGLMYGQQQGSDVTLLLTNAFKVVLALFLLDMGLTAAETLRPFPWHQWRALCFALLAPSILSLAGLSLGLWLELPQGSVLILAAITASASYIAAPVAIRNAIPKADIGLAMLMSLGLTFPFNVIIGIPLYHYWITLLSG